MQSHTINWNLATGNPSTKQYLLFNAKTWFISKGLITIINICSIAFILKFHFLFLHDHLLAQSYMISSIPV